MMKCCLTALLCVACYQLQAQEIISPKTPYENGTAANVQPFLFSVNSLTAASPKWNAQYSGSYGQRAISPFGYNGLDQQIAVKGYLGSRFTLFANVALGFARGGGINSAQQAEVIRDIIGGKKATGPRLGLSLGASQDWDHTKAVFSRITGSYDQMNWRLTANLRFEKAFSEFRDKIDLISSIGFHHRLYKQLFGGVEAVGQDLEGFWDKEEAEGGAKLLLGPSLSMSPENSRFAFSVCGGPIFYATRSNAVPSVALRELNGQNGYTVRAMMTFNFSSKR